MGTTFIKSQPEPETKLSTEWQKSKPTLIFQELFSEDSSEALSTPSCRSLEGDHEMLVKGIQETPALQELEETVMQARAAEDHKQARKLKARRSSITLVPSDLSDYRPSDPVLASSRSQMNRSRLDTWDVTGAERDLGSVDETPKKKIPDTKQSPESTRASDGSVPSDDSSFGSLTSTNTPAPVNERKKSQKKPSLPGRKSSKKLDKK